MPSTGKGHKEQAIITTSPLTPLWRGGLGAYDVDCKRTASSTFEMGTSICLRMEGIENEGLKTEQKEKITADVEEFKEQHDNRRVVLLLNQPPKANGDV